MRKQALILAVCGAMLVVPLDVGRAGAQSGKATGPPIKVGLIQPITSATAANPDTDDAFRAAIAAFNKRGGAGVNHSRIVGVVCDSRGDANGEVNCARRMEDEGVVATINDLTYNNPSGVVEIMEAAQIPRIGLGETDLAEFGSTVSYPVSAGIFGAYLGVGKAFADRGTTKVVLVRTDAPTGAAFRGFISPPYREAGVEVVGDVAIATGSTDYAPYVADIQGSGADAALLAIDDPSAAQLLAAMEQLNLDIQLGAHPGTLPIETLRKFKDVTKGTVLAESFPFPSPNNVRRFPGLEQFYADMKASGKEELQPKSIQPTSFFPWVSMLAFVNLTKDVDTITKESVVQALETAQDVDLAGLAPPWTPSTPGFSLFEASSNHFVYPMRFDGRNVVTPKQPIDISQFFP